MREVIYDREILLLISFIEFRSVVLTAYGLILSEERRK